MRGSAEIVGRVVDNYRITGVLGKGGMGIVYRAMDMTLDREVALKMMDDTLSRDEGFLKRFQSEARALAKLQNPNIVSVFALRETELGFCIVMEFVEGITLADIIREEGKLPIPRVIGIFRQLLTAFGHAHNVGIVHRDIKPSNVMLAPNDLVKVTDFGLAKIQQPSAATMTVGTGGTLFYMSPEQVRGLANVDRRGDLYSVGMTMYEALAGRTPFSDNETDFSIRQAIVEGKIPSIDKFNPALPKDLVRIIQKSIEKDPDRRFQTAGEFREALEHFSATISGPKEAAEKQPGVKKRLMPSKVIYVAISLVLTLLIGYVLYPMIVPPHGSLSIGSVPGGAGVAIDNAHIGKTPLSEYTIEPGTYRIRIEKAGYRAYDTVVVLERGGELAMRAVLVAEQMSERVQRIEPQSATPDGETGRSGTAERDINRTGTKARPSSKVEMSTLVLEAVPAKDVSVTVGGRTYNFDGRVQVEVQVPAGKTRVEFRHRHYGAEAIEADTRPGRPEKISCFFEASVGVTSVDEATGKSIWGHIVIDGQATELTTPTEMSLEPGRHTISVSKHGFEVFPLQREIEVKPGFARSTFALTFMLKKVQE